MESRKRGECEYAIRDLCGERVCMWNEDAPGWCELEACPLRGEGGHSLDVLLT